jgi:hypothetical protein
MMAMEAMNPDSFPEQAPLDAPDKTQLMPVEAVQQAIGRSRASVYRYANTDPNDLNPTYNPKRLNPELRLNKDDPLMFHPNEVARFAKDVLKQNVTINVKEAPPNVTQELLQAILQELQLIRRLLESQSGSN